MQLPHLLARRMGHPERQERSVKLHPVTVKRLLLRRRPSTPKVKPEPAPAEEDGNVKEDSPSPGSDAEAKVKTQDGDES